jgi:hypothetical protein
MSQGMSGWRETLKGRQRPHHAADGIVVEPQVKPGNYLIAHFTLPPSCLNGWESQAHDVEPEFSLTLLLSQSAPTQRMALPHAITFSTYKQHDLHFLYIHFWLLYHPLQSHYTCAHTYIHTALKRVSIHTTCSFLPSMLSWTRSTSHPHNQAVVILPHQKGKATGT